MLRAGRGYLAVSALTDYPLAVRRMIPFPAHGAIEGTLGAALPMLPKLFGFEDDRAAKGFLLGLTAITAVVASLTNWTGEDTESPRPVQAMRRQLERVTGRSRAPEPEEVLVAV